MTLESSKRVAIFGARGIGMVHARVFQELGADVCAVLATNMEGARATAAKLAEQYGIRAEPFADLTRLLELPLDAVSVCTPPRFHFQQMMAAFSQGIPVFCEKPLLWTDDPHEREQQLNAVSQHPQRRLFVNTSNASFLQRVRERLPSTSEIVRFAFEFHTSGPHRGRAIALDLLPHGISLLLRLLGRRRVSDLQVSSSEHACYYRFQYEGCEVEFDFRQREGLRDLSFRVNDQAFRRIQRGAGPTYRVFLRDSERQDELETIDPFAVYIADFLGRLSPLSGPDDADEAIDNLRMTEALHSLT